MTKVAVELRTTSCRRVGGWYGQEVDEKPIGQTV